MPVYVRICVACPINRMIPSCEINCIKPRSPLYPAPQACQVRGAAHTGSRATRANPTKKVEAGPPRTRCAGSRAPIHCLRGTAERRRSGFRHIQKDYPTDQSPPPATLKLTGTLGTARLLQTYLNNRWKESESLFPSHKPGSVSTKQVRNVVKKLAQEGQIELYHVDGTRGDPSDVTPHSLRHSVAYRMLHEEDARMYDVRNRLRHTSIQTTEKIYEHFLQR